MICGVAFGMDDTKSALLHEAAHVRSTNPILPKYEGEPASFLQAQAIPEMEALLDISEMLSIAQASPFPSYSQLLALIKPKHARAQWNRKALIKRQIDRSLPRLGLLGAEGCKSALDQLLWREMNAAKEADRLPDYYSPVIRDEVRDACRYSSEIGKYANKTMTRFLDISLVVMIPRPPASHGG